MTKTPRTSFPRNAVFGMGVALALLSVATGCSSDDDAATTTVAESSRIGGTAVARVLETATKAILVDQSITLEGDLACTANISLGQGTVTGSCAGTDTDGNAIASTLDGTASVTGVNRCSGTFIVTSADTVINENNDFNCI